MLYDETKGNIISENVETADSFLKKFLGLMGRKSLKTSSCMVFIGCNSIHMFFMRFAIDVVFLNRNYQVVYMKKGLKPWQVIMPVKDAYITVELREGTIAECEISNGDVLAF